MKKKKIRTGIFETNSSLTHSLVIVSNSDFKKWVEGKLIYYSVDETLIPPEDINKYWENCFIEKVATHYNISYDVWVKETFYTYTQWEEDTDSEKFIKFYTTESGDKIVVFGQFGEDR
jgi:hypothetical protein